MKSLFSSLQGKSVKRGEKDKVMWMESRNSAFLVKSLYAMLEPRCSILFPKGII